MSDNPIHSIKALLNNGKVFNVQIHIYPLNILNYCLLDFIDSIVLRGQHPGKLNLQNLVETTYIMSLPVDELKKIDLDNTVETLSKPALRWFKKNKKAISKNLEAMVQYLMDQIKLLIYLAPELTDTDKSTSKPSNGWIPGLAYFALNDLHVSITDVYGMPLSQLMLMMRQKIYIQTEGQSMTLQDKELIDTL